MTYDIFFQGFYFGTFDGLPQDEEEALKQVLAVFNKLPFCSPSVRLQ